MDELIVVMVVGFFEMCFTSKNGWGILIGVWMIILLIAFVVYAAMTHEPVIPEPTPIVAKYTSTEQSFIDLCKRNDGTPTRDIQDPTKLICI